MLNKKVNSIIISLLSLICLSIGALFGFAYVQFWSKSANKRTDFDNKEWQLLANDAINKEFSYFQEEISNSQFVINATEKLNTLPRIKVSKPVILGLKYFFDDSHFNEPDIFNLNGVYNFSKIEKQFQSIPAFLYSLIKSFIDDEINKISFLPQAIKTDLENFFQFQNIDNILKYLSSIFPDDFYLKVNQLSQFNLKNILLDNVEKNKTLTNSNFSHSDNEIIVSHSFDFSSFKNSISILDKNNHQINYPEIINKKVFSFTSFFGYYFDLNLKIIKKVPHSEEFNLVKKF